MQPAYTIYYHSCTYGWDLHTLYIVIILYMWVGLFSPYTVQTIYRNHFCTCGWHLWDGILQTLYVVIIPVHRCRTTLFIVVILCMGWDFSDCTLHTLYVVIIPVHRCRTTLFIVVILCMGWDFSDCTLHTLYFVIQGSSDAWFACLWHTRSEIHPLKVCPVCRTDPLNWLVRGVFTF